MSLPLLVAAALSAAPALAQTTLLNEVHTIAAPTTGVPQEYSFEVATSGTYTVTLTDLGAQLTPSAPLASVKMAVTSGDALVGAPLVGAGTLTLTSIPAGTYELHVIGMPGTGPGSGPFGIQVESAAMAQVATFQGTLALPSPSLPNGEGVLDDTFTVTSSGSYTVTLTDLQLPQSLTTLTLLLIAQGNGTPVLTLPSGGSYSQSVTLTSGVTYSIFAVGQANATANAGLFSAVVTAGGAGGAVVYGRGIIPIGGTMHLGSPGLAAGAYTLSLTDLGFSHSLTQLGGLLLLNGQLVPGAQLNAAGSTNFTAVLGTYEAYAAATAAATAPGTGTFAVAVTPQGGGAPVLSLGRGVTAAGSGMSAFAFDTSISAAATETVSLTDFSIPSPLTSVSLAAVQGGALLGTPINSATSLNISAASGPLSLVVFTQAAANGGLFGIDVAPSAGGTAVYDVTQAAGALFTAQQVAVTAAGNYSVTATDLGFPANFGTYATIVTQGTKEVGEIFGGGTFMFQATPGTYFVNFIAQATGSDEAGTFALNIASAPPAPAVKLSTDNTQVSSGGTVDLIWSSQNATSCIASGGWSGTQALSGTVTSAPLTTTTTFTLTCTGAGGMAAQSVTVTVSAAASSSGGGGGGVLDVLPLTLLIGMLGARHGARARLAPVTDR